MSFFTYSKSFYRVQGLEKNMLSYNIRLEILLLVTLFKLRHGSEYNLFLKCNSSVLNRKDYSQERCPK